jgi:hypothetical protein
MKKIIAVIVTVLLINVVAISQEAVKPGPVGFDVLRDSIAYGKIDTIIYKSKTVDTLRYIRPPDIQKRKITRYSTFCMALEATRKNG